MTTSHDIDTFLARFAPDIEADLRVAREHLALRFPRGYELVFDNYNALVFAFSPTMRASDAVVSIAGYPKWVTLFFAHGTTLPDPGHLLQGDGTTIRSVRLRPVSVLRQPAVQALLDAAIAESAAALRRAPELTTVLKAVSVKQRPRRPPVASPRARSASVGRATR